MLCCGSTCQLIGSDVRHINYRLGSVVDQQKEVSLFLDKTGKPAATTDPYIIIYKCMFHGHPLSVSDYIKDTGGQQITYKYKLEIRFIFSLQAI